LFGSHSLGLSAGYSESRDSDGKTTSSGNFGGNFSVSSSTKKWVSEQTSLTGNSVSIYVENKTTLKGAVIASTSNDLTLDTGSFEYIHIKDKDISYNFGGGANAGANYTGKPDEKNNTWSVNASYGFSQKRQTNFATIGEGTIIVRDGETDLSGLNRDTSISQYGTVDIGLKGGFTVDSSTVAFVTNPEGEIKNAIDSLKKGYGDAAKTTEEIYAQSIVLYEKAGEIIGCNLFYNDRNIQIKECIGMWSDKTESGMGWLIVKRIINDHDNNNIAGRYGEGFHIVMLENSTVEPYLVKGLDEFNGKGYIIENGKVQYYNVGTSKSSITPGYKDFNGNASNINAGNNMLPGDYLISAVIYEKNPFNKVKVLNSKGGTVLPSTGLAGTQNYIYVHSPLKADTWSGGIGCQMIVGFQDYTQKKAASNGGKAIIEGSYHLIDMSVYTK